MSVSCAIHPFRSSIAQDSVRLTTPRFDQGSVILELEARVVLASPEGSRYTPTRCLAERTSNPS